MINENQYYGSNNSSSMIFSDDNYNYGDAYPFTTSYPSPSVDCTLSLGTPSTRLSTAGENDKKKRHSCMSNFGWNILQSKPPPLSAGKHRAGNNGTTGGDPLLARRCASCDTTSTPLWRNGPRGPKSLCNACGIRFKKEERRATANATANNGGALNNSAWVHQNQKMPCFSSSDEFKFIQENDHINEYSADHNGVPFLTWRFNRPSFVHDFTR